MFFKRVSTNHSKMRDMVSKVINSRKVNTRENSTVKSRRRLPEGDLSKNLHLESMDDLKEDLEQFEFQNDTEKSPMSNYYCMGYRQAQRFWVHTEN